MPKTDAEIKQAVSLELKWDQHVKETDVGVEVKDGVVALTGTLASYGERLAAERAAHRVAGVLDVANDIEVKVPGSAGRTDAEIGHAVRHALEWDVFVPEQRIRSTISKGWVTLEGDVDFWSQRAAAEKAIRNLTGVCGVLNKLAVKAPAVFAGDVRRAITEALERRAIREAALLALDVKDGRVSVKGSVNTWAEKNTVLGAVRATPGVVAVDDQVQIQWRS